MFTDQPPLGTFRERLDWARRCILPPGRSEPFSATEMADMIGRKVVFDDDPVAPEHSAGYCLSKTYIVDMLNGAKTNPTLEVMRTLGMFFRTGSAFFADHDGEYAQLVATQVEPVATADPTGPPPPAAHAAPPNSEALAALGGQVLRLLLDNINGLPIPTTTAGARATPR